MEQCLRYMPNLQKTFISWLTKYTSYDEQRKKILRYNTKNVFDVNDNESFEKCIIEFMSGMTDQFAITVYNEIISF